MIKNYLLLIFPGCLLGGLSAYSILSYLLVPMRITLPLSFIISILIFGLTKYYSSYENTKKRIRNSLKSSYDSTMANVTFIGIFIIAIVIIIIFPSSKSVELFNSWEHIAPIQIIKLAAAVAFSFFLPGYALVMILDKEHKLTILLKLLLAYIFSILITGLTGYISASFGYEISDRRILIISPSIVILTLFIVQGFRTSGIDIHHISPAFYYKALYRIWEILRKENSKLIIFASLFALVILYTYYLNDGKIVVDQWFYHGRALLMSSAAYKDLSTAETYNDPYDPRVSDVNEINPPFFSALLSAFFIISGSPSVNAYTSINFLNMMPVFAFYYFFLSWIHNDKRRAVMLASTLFMLSSGFGWVYVLYMATTSSHITSALSSIDIISHATDRTYDIGLPTTFINVGHPDVTTPLIIIALPAGLILLGLIGQIKEIGNNSNKSNGNSNLLVRCRSRYLSILITLTIITAISSVGILAHDEFYLFIIIASTLMLFRKLPVNANYFIFFASFLSAMALVSLVDFLISPVKYYTQREILGIPLIALCFLYVSATWAMYWGLYVIRISNIYHTNINFKRIKAIVRQRISKRIVVLRLRNYYDYRRTKLALRITTVSIVAYLYLFTLVVWGQLSDRDIRSHVKDGWNVPWYLYPMKFGLAGLLGLAFVVSYIFKKIEKEILFVFGIMALIAFLAGPYYDEHRFGKYIMISMDAFASLLIYQIITSSILNLKFKLRPLISGILLGLVVISSSLSVLMFAGYVGLFTGISDYIEGGRRDFPTLSEMQLLNFLRDKVFNSKTYNVAVPEKDVDYSRGFITKIYGFSAIPRVKLLQSPLTLNASTLEGFYKLLEYSDTRYIVLPKKDFFDPKKEGSLLSSTNNNNNNDNIIQFALDSFPKVYEDKNYIVLELPTISPPSPKGSKIALTYQRDADELLSPLSNKTVILLYNKESFELEKDGVNSSHIIDDNIVNGISEENIRSSTNASTILALDDNDNNNTNSNKGTILWTHTIHKIQHKYNNGSTNSKYNDSVINYIESSFRIMDSNRVDSQTDKKTQYDDYNTGILWVYRNKEYQVLITKDGLELLQTPITTTALSKNYKQAQDNNNNDNNNKNIEETSSSLLLSQNQEIKREKGIWYNLKVVLPKNSINVYVNDILKIKVPIRNDYYPLSANKNTTDSPTSISKIGIKVFHDQAEFQPIVLGQISELADQSFSSYQKQKVYDRHYYPLSILALSNMKYDTFIDDDMSAFSKKYVILPVDPSSGQGYNASKYLEFVRNGGNLIVMNSDKNNVEGIFTKLLSIRPGNSRNFDGIISTASYNSSKIIEKKYNLNVSGVTQDIILTSPHDDITVKSFYTSDSDDNKNQKIVAPFTIEKNYGKGKIIFVNAAGYFDAIFKNSFSSNKNSSISKNQYFMTLANVPNLIDLVGLEDNIYVKTKSLPVTSLPATRIIGDLKIASGRTTLINSSSLLLPDSSSANKYHSYDLSLKELSISTSAPRNISILNHKDSNIIPATAFVNKEDLNFLPKNTDKNDNSSNFQYKFKKVMIRDLKLYGGPFEVIINSTNTRLPIRLPTSSSFYDYIAISIPTGFDMNVRLPKSKSAYVQFDLIRTVDEKQTSQTVKISGTDNSSYRNTSDTGSSNNEIYFHEVKADFPGIESISILMKSPEIRVLKEERQEGEAERGGGGNIAISFKEDSHKSTPIEIKNGAGNITAKVSYVDNYNQPYYTDIKTQFITYLEQQLHIISDHGSISTPSRIYDLEKKLKIEMPGDISEYAKKHGIDVPWKRALSSNMSILIAISIAVITIIIIVIRKFLPTIKKFE